MPKGHKRMSDSLVTNQGLKHDLLMPDITNYKINIMQHGSIYNSDMYSLGAYVKEIVK